jgi:hypothetical protein
MSADLESELLDILQALCEARSRLDGLRLHAAAADTNQVIERVQALLDCA